MNDIPLPSKYQGRSLEDLKSSLRAVDRKIDSMKIDAAISVGVLPLPEGKLFWIADEINWDDPKLDNIRESYFELVSKSSELHEIVGRLEAIQNNDLPRYEARKKADKFLTTSFNSFEEEANWLKKNGLNGLSLAEKILANPNFLNEVEL